MSAIAGGAAGGVWGLVLLGALILLAKQGGARYQGGDIEDNGEGQGEKPGASTGASVGGGGETRAIGEDVSPFPPGDTRTPEVEGPTPLMWDQLMPPARSRTIKARNKIKDMVTIPQPHLE